MTDDPGTDAPATDAPVTDHAVTTSTSSDPPPNDDAQPSGGTLTGPEGSDLAQMEDRWRRAVADLDNLRKRYARELERERQTERERVTSAFLPILDNIDRALEHAAADPRSIVEGVHALREQALAIVAGLGFQRQDEPGVPFDPTRHEVVGVVDPGDTDVAPGAVAQVLRPGYGASGRQLRPAAVTVAQRAGG
ncbi:molecular chaperone GrpE [Motilibacter peucedani]|uniref:Protein GrpE n=1 Tax=Motilibacter peucedani TaxID=598650 RepID=A0A420XK34_9ACTN|nr:nucleotide exchange factor GrpE [Motilibacter peucedani]RKS67875.1 molecular chaperone GrpE [Motilibacter peucedani]